MKKMSKKISIKLYLDGAPQFNSDIRNINNNLKMLSSELKVSSEQFKSNQNSMEALESKSEILNKQYEEAGKKVERYAERLQEIAKAHEKATSDYEEHNAALQKEQEKLEVIEKTFGKTSEEYKRQSEVVEKLSQDVNQTSDVLERLDAEEVKVQTSLNNATAEQIKYGQELTRTNAYLEEAKNSTDGCAKSIDQYGRDVSKADENTDKLTENLDKLAQNAALEKTGEAAKKLLENLIECAETAETFEYSIAKVQSIARASEEDLKGMSDEIRRVSTEMGYSANEVSEAVYQAISASVDASEAVGFVEDATKLARAGFTETTTAVDVLTTAINAYGKEANTTKHIADDLITTQNLGKTTVNELAQVMGTVIPTASALGVSLDQLSTMYVLLTKQGINTANATTYIRAMMNELSDAGSDLSETLGDISGHTFGELMAQGKTVGDVMQMLGDSVNGDSEDFKNLFSNVRAGLGGLSLFNQGADAFNSTLEKMGDNAGAADEAFATMADTAVMTNERFRASVENLKIAVGESLSPTIDDFKKKGIGVLEWITRIVEENPKLVNALAGAATGMVATTAAVTGLTVAIATLKLAFGDIKGAAVAIGAIVGGTALGAFGSLALAAENSAKKIEQSVDALKKTHEATKETAQTSQISAEHAHALAARYAELADCADLTDAEFEELNNIITELNNSVPGLSLAYRENKNVVEEGTVAIKDNIDAMIAQMKYQSDLEELTALYKEQAEAEKAVKEASDELTSAQEALAQKQYDLDHGFETSGEGIGDLERKVRKLTESQKEAQDIYDENKTKIEELSGSVEDYTKKTLEMEKAEEDAAASKLAEEQAQKDLEDAITASTEAIGKQIGVLDEWKEKSSVTFSEMQKRWEDQNKGIKQYSDDLAYVKGIIDSDADPAIKQLAEDMVSMGSNGAAELHEFVEGLRGLDDNTGAMAKLAETWQEHIDNIKTAEGIYASITLQEKGYVDESNALFETYYSGSEEAQKTHNEAMTKMASQGPKDQAKAIEKEMPKVETASQTVAETALKAAEETYAMEGGRSTVFYDMGESISNSMAEGMTNGTNTVAGAMKDLCEAAINAVDLSKVTEKLSTKVSEVVKNAEAGLEKTISNADRKARMQSGG